MKLLENVLFMFSTKEEKHQEWQYRLELLKLCYHPRWRLMRTEYRTCFHTLYDEILNNVSLSGGIMKLLENVLFMFSTKEEDI